MYVLFNPGWKSAGEIGGVFDTLEEAEEALRRWVIQFHDEPEQWEAKVYRLVPVSQAEVRITRTEEAA